MGPSSQAVRLRGGGRRGRKRDSPALEEILSALALTSFVCVERSSNVARMLLEALDEIQQVIRSFALRPERAWKNVPWVVLNNGEKIPMTLSEMLFYFAFNILMQHSHFGLACQCAEEALTVLWSCTHCTVGLSALRRWKKSCLELLLGRTDRHGMD